MLVRGWELPVLGNTDVTLESLAAGAAIGLRVVVVVIAFAVYSACVDPDRVLRALRPLARRSALTAALVNRLVPVTVADLGRLREAAALRGPGAAPVGRAAMARRLVAGSLDRTVDVAATLELRGHSLPAPRPARARALPRRPPAAPRRGVDRGRGGRRGTRRARAASRPIPGSSSRSDAPTLLLAAGAAGAGGRAPAGDALAVLRPGRAERPGEPIEGAPVPEPALACERSPTAIPRRRSAALSESTSRIEAG